MPFWGRGADMLVLQHPDYMSLLYISHTLSLKTNFLMAIDIH